MSRDYDEKVDNFFKFFEIPELQNAHLLQSNESSTDDNKTEENDEELSQAIAMSIEEDTKYDPDDDHTNAVTIYNNNINDSDDANDNDTSYWTCPLCTYQNNNSAKICEMCAVGDIDTINQTRDDKMTLKVDMSKPMNIETTLALLLYLDDTARTEGLRVISKTCNKLYNNISSWEKYGNLNYTKISQKLSKCIIALNLFEIAGFKKQTMIEKGERLIWDMNIENVKSLTKVVEILNLDESYMLVYAMALNNGGTHDQAMKAINQHIQAKQNGSFICVCGKCHLNN